MPQIDRSHLKREVFLTHDCVDSRCHIADHVMKEQQAAAPSLQEIGVRIEEVRKKVDAFRATLRK